MEQKVREKPDRDHAISGSDLGKCKRVAKLAGSIIIQKEE